MTDPENVNVKKPHKWRVKWQNIIDRVVEVIDEHADAKIDLRGLFYRLESLHLLRKTISEYKSLSANLVEARKQGLLSWDALSDEGRIVIGQSPSDYNYVRKYETEEEYVDFATGYLKHANETYELPRWTGQEHYVEVWCEKLTFARSTLEPILVGTEVYLAVNRGFSSWTFLYECASRLSDLIRQTKQDKASIHIKYFGDFDGPGEIIEKKLNEMLAEFGLQGIDFQRISVTQEQIIEYQLPTAFKSNGKSKSATTIIKKFIANHGGNGQTVELEAWNKSKEHLKAFKKLVIGSINENFDQSTYQREVLNVLHEKREEVSRLVKKKVRFLEETD